MKIVIGDLNEEEWKDSTLGKGTYINFKFDIENKFKECENCHEKKEFSNFRFKFSKNCFSCEKINKRCVVCATFKDAREFKILNGRYGKFRSKRCLECDSKLISK